MIGFCITDLGFNGFANNLFKYKGDNGVDGANSVAGGEEVLEVDGVTATSGVDEDEHKVRDESDKVSEVDDGLELAVVDEDGINVYLELLEWYQSKSDDEYFSESEDEKVEPKITRFMERSDFKKMGGGHIEFHVGQTHDNVFSLRVLLKYYVIQKCINYKKNK
ncbi:hypothetical protein Ddye_030354 [Dipteronia dyeriana]|uniref:Uncharacterized protein n=1 Tax=Dipteronia dyeriana TaxID=168575 RepID=A0AAD9TGW8_9ROSI|nr:hypothetical protein Ddye_030354 [Dipteronia dyeriana]